MERSSLLLACSACELLPLSRARVTCRSQANAAVAGSVLGLLKYQRSSR
jgi:hypothetical protein